MSSTIDSFSCRLELTRIVSLICIFLMCNTSGNLSHTKIRDIIPVELNAFMQLNAKLMSEFYMQVNSCDFPINIPDIKIRRCVKRME